MWAMTRNAGVMSIDIPPRSASFHSQGFREGSLTNDISPAVLNTKLATDVRGDSHVHGHHVFGRVTSRVKATDNVEAGTFVDVQNYILQLSAKARQREILGGDATDVKSKVCENPLSSSTTSHTYRAGACEGDPRGH